MASTKKNTNPDSPLPPDLRRRIHDMRSVYVDFKAVIELLQSGYRFDDSKAPQIFQQLEKSLAYLKLEIQELEKKQKESV